MKLSNKNNNSDFQAATLLLRDDIIESLLIPQECEEFDVKRVGKKLKVESILKTVCAMLNGAGGFLILGLEDSKKATGKNRVIGLEENPEALGDIKRDLARRIHPNISNYIDYNIIGCTLHDGSAGSICICEIRKSDSIHSIIDGGTYRRYGSQNRQLQANEIIELSFKRGTRSIVDEIVDIPIELLDTDLWKEYKEKRKLTRPIKEALKHIGLSKEDDDKNWKPKIATALLFAEHPGNILESKCAIRIFHYKGHQIEHAVNTNLANPPKTVDGPLLTQIYEATKKVMGEVEKGMQVSDFGFECVQEYPQRVIQEVITNAIIHRDYRLEEDIQIRIFANRIEIESPGCLPGKITAKNIREAGSHPRNKTLSNHLRDFPAPPNLDAGEGVPMMFAELKAKKLFPPIYQEKSVNGKESVLVILKNEARQSEWDIVEDYLKDNLTISNSDVRRILNINNTVKASKLLRKWQDSNLLVIANPNEGKRARKYRINSMHQVSMSMDVNLKNYLENVVKNIMGKHAINDSLE